MRRSLPIWELIGLELPNETANVCRYLESIGLTFGGQFGYENAQEIAGEIVTAQFDMRAQENLARRRGIDYHRLAL